jgi:type I restriction enzyme S subunit
MTSYPRNWQIESLDSLINRGIIKLNRGDIISKRDIAAHPGDYPIYSSAKENNGMFGRYGKFMFDEEVITWSIDGGGRLFYREKQKFSVTNVGGIMRILDRNVFDYKFLFYALTNLHSQVIFDWSRKAHPSVIRLVYDKIPIPPLPEQNKIVEILEDHLSRLDVALADVKQAKIKAAQFRRSLLESIFSGKLEDGTYEWPLTTIGEVSSKPQYGWTTSASSSGDIKLLRTTDLTRGPLNWDTVPYCEELPTDITKYLLAPGDILISRTGVGVGTSGLIESVSSESVFASYLIRIRVDNTLKPKFLYYFLQSPAYWKQIGFLKAGSAISNINVPKIQSIKVPIPALPIQEKVIQYVELRLSELSHYSKVIDEAEKKVIGFRRSLLQSAFTGQLTKEVASV